MRSRISAVLLAGALLSSTPALAQVGGLGSASLPTRGEVSAPPSPAQVLSIPREDVFQAPPGTYKPGLPVPVFPVFPGPGVWYPGLYGYGDHRSDRTFGRWSRSGDHVRRNTVGYLYLDVQPATAEVHIDGAYIGTVAELRQRLPGQSLDAGIHRLALRAPGFEALELDVRITPRETTTYRRQMAWTSAAPAPVPSAPAGPPRTFYVIPGCYAGDVHPKNVRPLPRCDLSTVRTVPPVVTRGQPAKPVG